MFLLFSPNSLCLTLMPTLVHQQPLNAGHLENAAVSFFSLPPRGSEAREKCKQSCSYCQQPREVAKDEPGPSLCVVSAKLVPGKVRWQKNSILAIRLTVTP